MMWAGDRKQGINKCWPYLENLLTPHQAARFDPSYVAIASYLV